jgi:1-acyl-sn-glycerol-3-phosphate acyltransferase
MLAGGIPVPLYPPLGPGDLAEYWRRQSGILRNCSAKRLITDETLQAHQRVLRSLTGVERVLTMSELDGEGIAPEPVTLAIDSLALLQYTSGSTADPKGVMVSHGNVLANLRTMGAHVSMDASDAFVSWLPLYHDMGLIGAWLGCLYYGAPLVLMPPQSFLLRPERWLWAIHQTRATLSAAPNFAYELCIHRITEEALHGLDLSSLRLAFCGAEPVFAQTLERFAARFARYGFRAEALYPVYGLAENTLGLTFPPPGRGLHVLHVERDDFLETGQARVGQPGAAMLSFVSCGSTLPGHELRIADRDEHELPDDRQGRVEFSGPSACVGYYRNPDATSALRRGAWCDSGDLGFLHEGELYLTGRVKDLIIRAGRHLHPQGIEQAVGELPDVRRGRVAAFGTIAPNTGTERLIIVAETRLTDAAAREALSRNIQGTVAALAGEPADEVVLAAPGTVLKTSSGKLRRSACRAAFQRGRLGARGRWPWLAVLGHAAFATLRTYARRLRALLFAGYAWCLFGLATPLAVVVVALLPTLAARWRAVRTLLALLRRALFIPLTCSKAAPLPAPPCIFIANHASYLDALVLVLTLPRPVAFVAKEELAQRSWLRWLLPRFGAVFVARFDPARCTAVVADASRSGRDFLFFPEGTFQRMPGLLPFHLGAFAAAAEAGLPVVPIGLRGTRAILHGVDWFPRHAPLTVMIGAPLLPQPGAASWPETLRLAGAARAFLLAQCGEPDLGAFHEG